MKKFGNDKILIKKLDGRTFECENCSVQREKVFIPCGEIPLEEGDIIVHEISDGYEQEFEVVDRGYYDGRLGSHFQAMVKRTNSVDETNSVNINTVNMSGDNSHLNINSIDNSINIINSISDELNKIPDEHIREEVLNYFNEFKDASDDENRLDKFSKITSILKNHVDIAIKVIPLLSQFF